MMTEKLIGGGAKNPDDFVKFLGRKSPTFGSPFQINFPAKEKLGEGMKELDVSPKKCNDEDVAYRCSCVDCPAVCPILPDVDEVKVCRVDAHSFSSFEHYAQVVNLDNVELGLLDVTLKVSVVQAVDYLVHLCVMRFFVILVSVDQDVLGVCARYI